MDRNNIIAALPSLENSKILLFERQNTDDIMKTILDYHKAWAKDYDGIATQFWKGNNVDTAKSIFNFLKKEIRYKIEPGETQTVKSPTVLMFDGKGDCKHYSLFIVGVFEALKRKGLLNNIRYRFAGYNNDNVPKHVFAVLTENGREYWIDPVLDRFNQRFPMPSIYKDFAANGKELKPNIGELYALSGVGEGSWTDFVYGNDQIGLSLLSTKQKEKLKKATQFDKIIPKLVQGQKTNAANLKKFVDQNVKSAGKDIKKATDKAKDLASDVWDAGKKVAMAPARNAFLLLMKINTFRYASQIWQKAHKDRNPANWAKVAKRWEQLGGNANQLWKEIVRGKDFYNKRHPNNKISGEYNLGTIEDMYSSYNGDYPYSNHQIGFEPTTTAAILAAAAPILAAMAALLSALGVNKQNENDGWMAPSTIPYSSNPELPGAQNDYGIPGTDQYSSPGDYSNSSNVPARFDNGVDSLNPEEERGVLSDFTTSMRNFYEENKKPILIGGGIIVAAYVLPKIFNSMPKRRRR